MIQTYQRDRNVIGALMSKTADKGPHILSEFTKRLACNIYTGHVESELDR